MRFNRLTITSVVAAAAVAAGGSAALAADGQGTAPRCTALLAKVAEKRGVSVEQLRAAVRTRLVKAIDAAQQSGRITAEQAAARRARVAEATGCKVVAQMARSARRKARGASRGMLAAAAGYLGVSKKELVTELKQGTTLAQLAAARDKTVDGLEAAMLARAKTRLAKAVEAKRITAEQRAERLERLEKLADRLVTHNFGRT
jgi:hypothetical protein